MREGRESVSQLRSGKLEQERTKEKSLVVCETIVSLSGVSFQTLRTSEMRDESSVDDRNVGHGADEVDDDETSHHPAQPLAIRFVLHLYQLRDSLKGRAGAHKAKVVVAALADQLSLLSPTEGSNSPLHDEDPHQQALQHRSDQPWSCQPSISKSLRQQSPSTHLRSPRSDPRG